MLNAIVSGCIPVILVDNVQQPFETLLDWDQFSVHVPVRDIPQLDKILQGIPPAVGSAQCPSWHASAVRGQLGSL